MNKKKLIIIFLSFLAVAFLLSLFKITKRIFLEENKKIVEIAASYEQVKVLSFTLKKGKGEVYDLFKKKGLVSVVIPYRHLKDNIKEAESAGLNVIVKVRKEDNADLDLVPLGTTIIFENNEIFDPDKIVKNNLKAAFVEFYKPVGFDKVPVENVITLHTYKTGEVEKFSKDEIVKRFVRAAIERKMKVLYVKMNFAFKDVLNDNLQMVADLSCRLGEAGFFLGRVDENPYITKSGVPVLLKKIAAFLIAVCFPVIGFIFSKSMKTVSAKFLVITLASFFGGISISGLLSDSLFLIKLEQFSGIKISLILPVVLVFALLIYENKKILKQKKIFQWSFTLLAG